MRLSRGPPPAVTPDGPGQPGSRSALRRSSTLGVGPLTTLGDVRFIASEQEFESADHHQLRGNTPDTPNADSLRFQLEPLAASPDEPKED